MRHCRRRSSGSCRRRSRSALLFHLLRGLGGPRPSTGFSISPRNNVWRAPLLRGPDHVVAGLNYFAGVTVFRLFGFLAGSTITFLNVMLPACSTTSGAETPRMVE